MTPGASSQMEAEQDAKHGYAPVNGLDMYYEIHGSGSPLVLLHGAFSAIGTSFGQPLSTLASRRRVIRLLGGGVPRFDGSTGPSQLAILPGSDHMTLMTHADLLAPMVNAFLDAPAPERV